MHGFAGGRIGDLGMSDFHYADPTSKISLGGTTFTGLIIPASVKGGMKAPPFSGAVALDQMSVETSGDAAKPDATPASHAGGSYQVSRSTISTWLATRSKPERSRPRAA